MADIRQSEAKTNAHGLDRDLWAKIDGKFDPIKAQKVLDWICAVTGEDTGGEEFGPALKNGYLVAKLIQTIDPEVKNRIKKRRWKPKKTNMPFQCREQIELFGKACKNLGMNQTDLFTAQDLYEQENLNQVMNTLYSLNAIAQDVVSFDGPYIEDGFAKAQENRRNFSEETLRKGANAIPFASRGAIDRNEGARLDGAGILKTAGNEDHKVSNVVPQWSQGSIAHESDRRLDGAGIMKNAGNEDWRHDQSTVPITSRGGIARH